MFITKLDGTKIPIKQGEVTVSQKTLEIHNASVGGNKGHLDHIKDNATTWVNRMTNGHPSQPHLVGSIQTPIVARTNIWSWYYDKRHQAGRKTT
jgi:hypothetical protein